MLDVFIAFLGGTYHAGKLLADASDLKRDKLSSDRRCVIWTERLHAWEALVVDRAMQEDLLDFVSKHREGAWLEVQKVCQETRFQKSYTSANEWAYDGALDKTKAGCKRYRRHRLEEPLDIMLAKRGKLRWEVALSAITHLKRGEGQGTRYEWDRTVEFWVYIRDELRKNGIDAQLLFECEQPAKKYFDINDVDKFRYQPGKLTWLPYSWVDSNLLPL